MNDARIFAGGGIKAAGKEGIGALILDNPTRKNVITQAMWRAIPDALDWIMETGQIHAIIITGGGQRDFSAGADISEFSKVRANALQARAYEAENSEAFKAIRTLRIPVIAAIRGACYGGACGLAAAADFRIADETAIFAIPAARLGLAYPADAVGDLLRTLGGQMARRILFTGAAISAADLSSCGFIDQIVEAANLEEAAFSLAQTIARNAPLSVSAAKLALRAFESQDDDLLAEAAILGATTFESQDYLEGRTAFMEKRPPIFTGE